MMATLLLMIANLGAPLTTVASSTAQGRPIPEHVFAPYFEAWTGDQMTTVAKASGARYFTMAFLQTATTGSCTITWNGDPSSTMSAGLFVQDLSTLRKLDGDMIPSFGGFTADDTATEIADSCTSVSKIAAAYESVVERYNVTRLDMDIEDNSLSNTAGIHRRSKAIKMLEDWAQAHDRQLQISYTLPTSPSGLEPDAIAVLQSAVANHARVDVVNIMTFDYYDGVTTDMSGAAIGAAKALHHQLAGLYPSKSSGQLWAMEGNTIMIGIDDYPGLTEVSKLSDADKLLDFARSRGISTLSFWAIQRDNGKCPGTNGSDDCSGIVQKTWAFSHVLTPFTHD
jgi:chitinase